ncbi:MAG: acyl-CoA reductase [Sciscionella sp.]
MTRPEPSISWLPGWVPPAEVERVHASGATRRFQLLRPREECWTGIAKGLRRAGDALGALGIAEIVAAIDVTARHWCDRDWPQRRTARDLVVAGTGLSAATVERSFDVELRNYRADVLWRVLARELGDPRVLDEPCPDAHLAGATMAIGPDIVCQVFTGNVPGLPALGIVRSLLVKSAVIAKVASGEPTFAARFAASLAKVDRRLADAVLVTYWDRDDVATRNAVIGEADVVVAYGGDEACAAIQRAVRSEQRFVVHGDRVSFGLLSNRYLRSEDNGVLAAAIARDASMFDQHACIAAQAYLVEGETDEVGRFAARVAEAMAEYAGDCPLGELEPDAAAALQLRRAEAQYRAAGSSAGRVWSEKDWTVVLDDALDGHTGSGNRMLRIVAVPSIDRAVELLRPFGGRLQNVGVGGLDGEMPALATALARLGATRLCAPGRMPDPSLTWRHDGRTCVADLVRWCDVEMHSWATREQAREQEGAADASIAAAVGSGLTDTGAGGGDRLHAARR